MKKIYASSNVALRSSVKRRARALLFGLLLFVGLSTAGGSEVAAAVHKRAKRQARSSAAWKRQQARVRGRGLRRKQAGGREMAAALEREREGEFEPSSSELDEDADGRQQWFLEKRAYPFGAIPLNARRAAWDSRPVSKGRNNLLAQQVWTPIGPVSTAPDVSNWGVTSGRITAIAVSPANTQIVLVGSAAGGIWRSTDGGANFAPTSDTQVDLAVGTIAFAPNQPNVVYAGMGDVYGYLGTGILKSTDSGQTWTRVTSPASGLPEAGFIFEVLVDPNDANHVFAAQSSFDPRNGAGVFVGGLYISTDGGANWIKTFTGQPRDIAFQPGNPQTLYLAIRRFASPADAPGVFKSTDGGHNWNRIYTSPFTSKETGLAAATDVRVSLSPAAPNRVYLYIGNVNSGTSIGFSVSDDGGQSWTERSVVGLDRGQFGYNTYMVADPSNPNTVYVGGRDVFRSNDGGATWVNLTKNFTPDFVYAPHNSNAHGDQHALAFSPDNPNVIYIGNDGGLNKSTDGGNTFQSLNATLSLSQFVGITQHPTNPAITYGGTQDNGTQRRGAASNQWTEFAGGDGGHVVVNQSDPSVVFATYIYGTIWRYTQNGDNFDRTVASNSTFGEGVGSANPRIAFYPPFTGNGVNQRLYFGTWRLYTSDTLGSSWILTGTADLTKGPADVTANPPRPNADVLSAIGVARSNTNVIYTGSAQGRAMVSTDAGGNWTDISAGLPNRFIEYIAVDASNPANAYLAVSGYGSGHVFKTVNMGATWTDVSGNLPNIPTAALLIDPANPNIIYAGTDIGVFRSTTGGNAWETFNHGLPPVPVTEITANPNGRIQLATYGRGAYELTTDNTTTPAVVNFDAVGYSVAENGGHLRITLNRSDATGAASVDYSTADGTANDRSDYAAAFGTLRFAGGETSKSFDIFITDDVLQESAETFTVTLGNAVNLTLGSPNPVNVQINNNDSATGVNPVKDPNFDASFFVRQHYIDFFNREPDAPGLSFWTNQINECTTQSCREIRRVNVSAAFFLSTEFQETGYLVYRFYQAAFNTQEHLRLLDFLPDTQEVGRGIIVGQGNWQAQLEANKQAFAQAFVARPAFLSLYPLSMSAAQFVDALNTNTGNSLSQTERDSLVNQLTAGQLTRAQVLRTVAENSEFSRRHFNRAFVLMQYFGYLRRNPNDAPELNLDFSGYNFWLGKLNQFNGNYVSAEMVKAFITAGEYQQRFGP